MFAHTGVNQILFKLTRKVQASLCRILRNTLCSTEFYADLLCLTSPNLFKNYVMLYIHLRLSVACDCQGDDFHWTRGSSSTLREEILHRISREYYIRSQIDGRHRISRKYYYIRSQIDGRHRISRKYYDIRSQVDGRISLLYKILFLLLSEMHLKKRATEKQYQSVGFKHKGIMIWTSLLTIMIWTSLLTTTPRGNKYLTPC